jgi:hypothetical protein
MSIVTELSLASALALLIAAPAQAQSPKQGDYYAPTTQTVPSPPQEQGQQQGDYYKPTTAAPQTVTPAEQQQNKQGDYYKPGNQ